MIGKIGKLLWTRMSFQIDLSHRLFIRGIVQAEYWLGRIFVVLLLTHVWIFAAQWVVVLQASLSFTISQSLLKLIQPSWPLSSPSPPAFNLSQHPGLFQWVNSLHQVTKVLELQASASVLPMNIQDWFPLGLTDLISLQSKRYISIPFQILFPIWGDAWYWTEFRVLYSRSLDNLTLELTDIPWPGRESEMESSMW